MNTILTDDERPKLPEAQKYRRQQRHDGGYELVPAYTQEEMEAYANAREAAVLAKLREQEPVADVVLHETPPHSGVRWLVRPLPVGTKLYAAPLPAVVQVPQGWKLVPVEPTDEMVSAIGLYGSSGVYERDVWATMLAAAPEAPATDVVQEFDYKHPRAQALIGADARHRIIIDLIWQILEDPRREFTASDMEYWDKLHDKVQEVALAAAPEAPAQGDPLEKLTRIQEELGLYNDKPAQGKPAFPVSPTHATGDEAWIVSAGGRCAAFVSEEDADEWLEGQGLMPFGQQQDYTKKLLVEPSVPAPWREAMKVMREALKIAQDHWWTYHDGAKSPTIEAALAQLDSLEGGE